jgi:hypothetical protein
MGIQICACTKDAGIIQVPYTDFSLENNNNFKKQQKIINSQLKLNKDSICLPNGNNINSFFDNKDNQNNPNDLDHFDISLSPITNARKNININIININNESSNIKQNTSNNNISSLNNINTDKIYDQLKLKSDNSPVLEESCEKEESNNQENGDESKEEEEEDSKIRERRQQAIEKFDNLIKEFAEYITDDRYNEAEKSEIKQIEEHLDDMSIESNENNDICFIRPALLFKKDNSIYKGSWNFHGKKEGFGTFIDSKGNKYLGEWKDDKLNGKGRLFSVNGDYYEGFFKDGIIEGYGMYYSKMSGYKYMGDFKNYKFHGKGKLIYDDKMTYEGNFFEGYKNGEGKLTFKDGAYYEGDFEKNIFNGKGKFHFKDGRRYNGDWKNNIMEGKGTFNWGNDCKYIGDYKNNKREGNGVYSFGCNLYDGNWLNNMPHGEGTLLVDGLRIVGHFRYGKIMEMKEGKGANREMTQRFTIDSRINNKSLDDTTKGMDKSDCNDSRNIKAFKYASESGSKIEKRNKKNESISKYGKSKTNKKSKSRNKSNKSKDKSKDKEKDKDKKKKK